MVIEKETIPFFKRIGYHQKAIIITPFQVGRLLIQIQMRGWKKNEVLMAALWGEDSPLHYLFHGKLFGNYNKATRRQWLSFESRIKMLIACGVRWAVMVKGELSLCYRPGLACHLDGEGSGWIKHTSLLKPHLFLFSKILT